VVWLNLAILILLVVADILLAGGTHTRRFGELKDSLPGITSKVLSARLKELED